MDSSKEQKYSKTIAGIRPYFHVVMVAVFHLISGFFEIIGAAIISGRGTIDSLTDAYISYLVFLGLATIVIGFLLLLKVNFARVLAIILAWWNLFTSPTIKMWFPFFMRLMKNISITDTTNTTFTTNTATLIIYLLMTLIRLYIIIILHKSKAGYIFLKEHKRQ